MAASRSWGGFERRARADKPGVIALEHPCLFGVQTKLTALPIQARNTGIEGRIEIERIVVAGGETSRSTASTSSDVSAPASTKNRLVTRSSSRPLASAPLWCCRNWLRRVSGNRIYLSPMVGQSPVEGGAELIRG